MHQPLCHNFVSPPIASPTENMPPHYGPKPPHRPGRLAIALGHFLWFGFLGQIAFALSLFFIPNESRGAVNHTFMTGEHWVYLAMCLPGLGAFGGVASSFLKPLSELGQTFRMALTFIGMIILAVIDLFGLIIWSWHGYC